MAEKLFIDLLTLVNITANTPLVGDWLPISNISKALFVCQLDVWSGVSVSVKIQFQTRRSSAYTLIETLVFSNQSTTKVLTAALTELNLFEMRMAVNFFGTSRDISLIAYLAVSR